jgi:hypothetical protein
MGLNSCLSDIKTLAVLLSQKALQPLRNLRMSSYSVTRLAVDQFNQYLTFRSG